MKKPAVTLDPQWLDSMYNNRALVPEHPTYLARWAQDSVNARQQLDCQLDLAYGSAPGEKLDIFSGQPRGSKDRKSSKNGKGTPVIVFIHGGYWRSLDKADHSFIAPELTKAGACVVMPNYDLCPAVTIPQITMQMVRALTWTYRNIAQYGGDPSRITIVGHSAGGHLVTMLLACAWPDFASDLPADLVKNALSISGLYDLEPIAQTPFLKDSLKLTSEQVLRASPVLLPKPNKGTLYSVAGADESAEFVRQNLLIQKVWGRRVVPVCEALAGLNHFSVLDALIQPGHRLNSLALKLAGLD
ncbi:MAG: alpha/beta hydrolase [Polaromonas sp.]|nr:alpha/beta hydrolase [Polaromonas sp.]